MLGISKSFLIFLILSIIIGIGTKNWKNGAVVMLGYAVVCIVWRFITWKR